MDVLPFIIKDLLSMRKTKRELLDCIPFFMLCLSLIISLVLLWSNNSVVQWQHYLGFVFLSCNAILFKRNQKKGVIFLGLIIILGIVGWLTFQFGLVGRQCI